MFLYLLSLSFRSFSSILPVFIIRRKFHLYLYAVENNRGIVTTNSFIAPNKQTNKQKMQGRSIDLLDGQAIRTIILWYIWEI